MKTTAIHLFLSVVVGVLIVGGAYHIMETITPETSAVKPSTLTSVSTNNEQYTSLAPTVHQAKPYKHTAHSTSAKAIFTAFSIKFRELLGRCRPSICKPVHVALHIFGRKMIFHIFCSNLRIEFTQHCNNRKIMIA